MRYASLAEVLLRHEFYADGICPDFQLEPSERTAQILEAHRCVCREAAGGLRIVTALDKMGQPFLPLPEETVLRFCLRLRNAEFLLFTQLANRAMVGARPLAFRNEGVRGELQPTESPAGAPGQERGVFALIDLSVIAAAPVPQTFVLTFSAKRVRWAYYVVTGLKKEDGELRVLDHTRREAPITFTAETLWSADKQPDSADPIAQQLALQHPGARCVRFTSDQSIACQQQPGRILELSLDSERLVSPLPLPSVRSLAREDLLYRVIKHSLRAFQTP